MHVSSKWSVISGPIEGKQGLRACLSIIVDFRITGTIYALIMTKAYFQTCAIFKWLVSKKVMTKRVRAGPLQVNDIHKASLQLLGCKLGQV